MYVRHFHRLQEQAADVAEAGAVADAAAATAAGEPVVASAPAADGAPGGATPQPGSLLARGAGLEGAGSGTSAADAVAGAGEPGDAPAIPEKFLVKNEDGSINHEQSALKLAASYRGLEQRLGAGDAPPKSADEYAPELPEGLTLEALKADPLFTGFLKGAHAKGMTNAQVSYAIGQFQQRMALAELSRNDPAIAEVELQKVWTTEQQMTAGLRNSYRAAKAFAEDETHAAALEKKFGNDPDFIRLMAKIGGELGEDKPVQGLSHAEAETLETLKMHPAYMDAKHPEHRAITAKVTALYQKQYAGA